MGKILIDQDGDKYHELCIPESERPDMKDFVEATDDDCAECGDPLVSEEDEEVEED